MDIAKDLIFNATNKNIFIDLIAALLYSFDLSFQKKFD